MGKLLKSVDFSEREKSKFSQILPPPLGNHKKNIFRVGNSRVFPTPLLGGFPWDSIPGYTVIENFHSKADFK